MLSIFDNCRRALFNSRRQPGIDYLRGVAIICVVFHHYHFLPYGYLGVDLFFAISGFLVGGSLLERLTNWLTLDIKLFYLKRFTKILPSYITFIVVGGLLSVVVYGHSRPDAVLRQENLPKYFFFYLNYRMQDSLVFAHIWSLCIEEHFYLFLPVFFLVLRNFKVSSKNTIVWILIFGILMVNLLRLFLAVKGHETLVTTHSRIDSMMWGMLAWLNLKNQILSPKKKIVASIGSIGLLALLITIDYQLHSMFFTSAIFHGLTPIVCFLLLIGVSQLRLPNFNWLRFISYFSYNYYLWHMLFFFVILNYFGKTLLGLVIFAITGFTLAIAANLIVEEPGLKLRAKLEVLISRRTSNINLNMASKNDKALPIAKI